MFMMVNLKTINILKELFMGIISVQKLLSMKVLVSASWRHFSNYLKFKWMNYKLKDAFCSYIYSYNMTCVSL